MEAVALPRGEELREWLAVNVVDFCETHRLDLFPSDCPQHEPETSSTSSLFSSNDDDLD